MRQNCPEAGDGGHFRSHATDLLAGAQRENAWASPLLRGRRGRGAFSRYVLPRSQLLASEKAPRPQRLVRRKTLPHTLRPGLLHRHFPKRRGQFLAGQIERLAVGAVADRLALDSWRQDDLGRRAREGRRPVFVRPARELVGVAVGAAPRPGDRRAKRPSPSPVGSFSVAICRATNAFLGLSLRPRQGIDVARRPRSLLTSRIVLLVASHAQRPRNCDSRRRRRS